MKKWMLGIFLAWCIGYVMFRYPETHPTCEKGEAGKKTVVCIGDSITFGAKALANRRKEAWPYVLDDLLGDEWQALNYGIPGATARKDIADAYRKRFLREAIRLNGDVYVVMLGTNDTKPGIFDEEKLEEGLRKILSQLPGRIVLASVPWSFPNADGTISCNIDDAVARQMVNPAIQRLAQEYNAVFVDVHGLTQGHPEYFADGVHPGKEGNQVIAKAMQEAVYQCMKAG